MERDGLIGSHGSTGAVCFNTVWYPAQPPSPLFTPARVRLTFDHLAKSDGGLSERSETSTSIPSVGPAGSEWPQGSLNLAVKHQATDTTDQTRTRPDARNYGVPDIAQQPATHPAWRAEY